MNTGDATNLDTDDGASSTNPLAKNLNITLSIPETISIRMVDASVLADFEIWFFVSSLLFSATIGFLVPFVQSIINQRADILIGANAGVFLILFVVSICVTIYKRCLLRKKSRDITLAIANK